jgi:hypothetical protein
MNDMSVRDKIENGFYKNKVKFPSKQDFTTYNAYKCGECLLNVSKESLEYNKDQGYLIETFFDVDSYKKIVDKYREEENKIYCQFKKDLLEELGIADHPKAELLFNMAWDRGHSCGYSEVLIEAGELSELLV